MLRATLLTTKTKKKMGDEQEEEQAGGVPLNDHQGDLLANFVSTCLWDLG